jgi:hypothetical protein
MPGARPFIPDTVKKADAEWVKKNRPRSQIE